MTATASIKKEGGKRGRKEGKSKWKDTLRNMELVEPLRVTVLERNYIYKLIRELKQEGFDFKTRICLDDDKYANIIRLK